VVAAEQPAKRKKRATAARQHGSAASGLGEKEPEGHERGKESVAEGHRFVAEGLLDGVGIEELGQR